MNRSELKIFTDIAAELDSAREKYPNWHSTHEGYAVILEEVHELWDEVRRNKGVMGNDRMREECKQIAAMAVRFILDLC